MKKLTSMFLCFALVVSLLVLPTHATTQQSSIYGTNTLFAADFDILTPAPLKMEQNAEISWSDSSNALKILKAQDAEGNIIKNGAYYSVKPFTHGNTFLMLDVMRQNAGYHFQMDFWDANGTAKAIRINMGNASASTWYTYIINTASKVAYCKEKSSTTWEEVSLDVPGVSTSDKYTNTVKFGSGSGSSNYQGIWHIDNISLYSGSSAISAILPADITKTHPEYVINEDFEGSTNIFTISTGAECNAKTTWSLVEPDAGSDNTVFDMDLSSHTTFGAYWSTYYKGRVVNYPTPPLPYTVSFKFRRLNDAFESEAIGVVTGGPTSNDRIAVEFPITCFDKGEWYNISFNLNPSASGVLGIDSKNMTATKLSDGTVTTLPYYSGSKWSSSLADRFTLYPTVRNSSMLSSELRKTAHYQVDDIKVSYETSDLLKTNLITSESLGTVTPIVAGYDESGVLLTYKEGTASSLETISNFGGTSSYDFDIYAVISDFANADSVKVLYWDNLSNAKPYAPYTEIGDAISATNGNPVANTNKIDISASMLPAGATGNYTVFAYTVSFAETSDNIPAYDPDAHTLLALNQFNTAPECVYYDATLYDSNSQDIVLVINADGASEAKKILIEEVTPPSITNVVMQLGADETERNFTWFSLRKDEGKITYAKAEDMVDGTFPEDATTVIATRDNTNGKEYSLKAFYYNNKATITGLEPNTTYYYQLSNGTSKTQLIPFTTGTDGSSFSFAFGGDAQVGGSEFVDYAQETLNWGKTIKQMTTNPAFDGIEFFLSAGDQVDSFDRNDGSADDIKWDVIDEQQYDIYTSPEEFLSFPQVVTYGNHDPKTQGKHYQHFNPPNMPDAAQIINGSVSGASTYTAADKTVYPQSADHYFTYKSALFIMLNGNGYLSSKTYSTTVEASNKAFAEKQAAFVKNVTDMYADDPEIMWTIVVYHQSPYGSSYHGNYKQTVAADGTVTFGRSEQQAYIDMRKYLLPALDECDVDMVLSGHDHVYTRTHILKPATDENGNYTYEDDATITPYADGTYTFADGTTTPTFNTTWRDTNGVVWSNLQVKSKPVKVTNPDGILHVTGATSSGSQVNNVEYTSRFTAANAMANTRHMSRIDITPTSLKLEVFNLGTDNTEVITTIDKFEIERTSDVDVAGITLADKEISLATGLSKNIGFSFIPAEPTINNTVTWSSDNTSVATVDNGIVTAHSVGTATITVTTANGKTATCTVTVTDKVAVSGITIPESITMEALTTKTVTATVAPDNASKKELTWTSDNEDVATVSRNGSITAHKHGNATITATATDGSGITATINVNVTYVPSTVIFPDTFTMETNSTAQLSVEFAPDNATYKNVSWKSSDESIVTVDKYGNLSSLSTGTAIVTATTPERVLECEVTVTGKVLFEQNMEDPNNTTFYDKFYLGEVAWTRVQDNDGNWILDMNQNNITKGFAGIKNSRSETPANTVIMPPLSGYTFDFDFRKVSAVGLGAINFRAYNQNGSFAGFKLKISDLETNVWYDIRVITDKSGKRSVLYKKADSAQWVDGSSMLLSNVYNGSSAISPAINYMDIMAMYILNSSEISTADQLKTHWQMDNLRTYVDVPAEGFALENTSANLIIGDTCSIAAVFTPSNVTDNHVAYQSSDSTVATVDRFGKVKAIGKGTATITATSSATQTSSTFTVNVSAPAPVINISKNDGNGVWNLTVTSENIDGGLRTYVGAYTAGGTLISASSAEFKADGNILFITKDSNIGYFKAFIWGTDNAPCVSEKILSN